MSPVIHKEDMMPIQEARAVLSQGGVLLYPTDTLYALGVDPLQKEAMQRLFSLKQRPEDKKVSYIFSGLSQAGEYVRLTKTALSLEKFLPGKLTLILESGDGSGETVGVRVPDNAFCLELAASYGPVTATSANISGGGDLHTVRDILKQIPDISMAVEGGDLHGPGSTVIDARGDQPIVLRQGAFTLNLTRYVFCNL